MIIKNKNPPIPELKPCIISKTLSVYSFTPK